MLDDIEELSTALFESAPAPITVWQLALESFRADDVKALHAAAPGELTPVMNRLYGERDHVIGFQQAFEGGVRTVHNLASLLCGVGSFPFSVAIGRDLGHFPLRCVPDVLSDGGFRPRVFYPSDISFENMLEFFRYHGMAPTQAVDMPAGLPTGTWRAVSDRALYEQALTRASPDRSEYNFVLTLSGHSPFAQPTDMPADALARTQRLCEKLTVGTADDCLRLGVIAYADYALGEFLEKLERSPAGSRSIVVISADHATGHVPLWGGSEERARAHVPYLVYVPRALLAHASHPERIAPLLARLNERVESLIWSLTDSPTLVTALVSGAPQMKRIPAEWRFHTFGGQATSEDFLLVGKPEAVVWGTDSESWVFYVDAKGEVTADEKKNRPFSNLGEFDSMNLRLRGPGAFLGSFVKGYLLRCEKEAKLRMTTH